MYGLIATSKLDRLYNIFGEVIVLFKAPSSVSLSIFYNMLLYEMSVFSLNLMLISSIHIFSIILFLFFAEITTKPTFLFIFHSLVTCIWNLWRWKPIYGFFGSYSQINELIYYCNTISFKSIASRSPILGALFSHMRSWRCWEHLACQSTLSKKRLQHYEN